MRCEAKIATGISVIAGFLGAVGCGTNFEGLNTDTQVGTIERVSDIYERQFHNNPGPQVVMAMAARAQAERSAREAFDKQARTDYAAIKFSQIQADN